MICCKIDQDTPFCAHCGKDLADIQPLIGLLKHCRSAHRSVLTTLQDPSKIRCYGGTPEQKVEFVKMSVERKKRAAVKWERWINALQDVLEMQGMKRHE